MHREQDIEEESAREKDFPKMYRIDVDDGNGNGDGDDDDDDAWCACVLAMNGADFLYLF